MTVTSNTQISDSVQSGKRRKQANLLNAIERLEQLKAPAAEKRVAIGEAYFRLALLSTADIDDSLRYLQKAIESDPFHPKLFFHFGRLLHRTGDFYSATVQYRHALRLAPQSHRILAHLALTLVEQGRDEKEIGKNLLAVLSNGDENKVAEQLQKLDKLLETRQMKEAGKKVEAGSTEEGKAEESNGKATLPDNDNPVRIACRWQGIWRAALMEHLARPELVSKQVKNYLEMGATQIDGQKRVTEYAVSLLFLMLSGESPKAVEKMAKNSILEPAEHPALLLLKSALALAQAEKAQAEEAQAEKEKSFIGLVERDFENGLLPVELICLLHYANYSLEGKNPLSLSDSLKLLNSYPETIKETNSFRELRIAILDGFARKAWRDERFDHAKILWREISAIDPRRIAAAHNLALVAAQTKSSGDYQSAWNRLAELYYLYAAAAGDVRVLIEHRKTMSLSIAQQSQQRYYDDKKSHPEEKTAELKEWMTDRDALEVWLREWNLYYLNSRFEFRSPTHLLGIPRDASQQTVKDARDALLNQIALCLEGQHWAGGKTFCHLAKDMVDQAAERSFDAAARVRDAFYEKEKPKAEALTNEVIAHGFLLHEMLLTLLDEVDEAVRQAEEASGENINASYIAELTEKAKKIAARNCSLGCLIAVRLFALPWKLLQPILINQGRIEKSLDLIKMFEKEFMALAIAEQSAPENEQDFIRRLGLIDKCRAVLPDNLDLAIFRCRLLSEGKKNEEAYTFALEIFPAVSCLEDREKAETVEHNLIVTIDNIAFSEVPDELLGAKTIETAKETVRVGCAALKRFPQAGGFRAYLSDLMIQIGEKKYIDDAIRILQEGLEMALNEKQREKFQELLGKASPAAKTAVAVEEIKKLIEGASKRVNKAFESLEYDSSPANLQNVRSIVDAALTDARRAEELATREKLEDWKEQAVSFRQQLEDALRQLKSS